MENNGIGKLFEGVDRWTVLIYVLIVLVGFVCKEKPGRASQNPGAPPIVQHLPPWESSSATNRDKIGTKAPPMKRFEYKVIPIATSLAMRTKQFEK